MRRLLILLFPIATVVLSCIKTEPVSTIPEITFKSLEALLVQLENWNFRLLMAMPI